ncbi:MAG: hypothetical protein JWQ48_583 [Conexibacter sp.]|nr:hypothetical protein [Conexibacter sp.]
MNFSFTCFRSTAYHRVVASLVPWIRYHGRAGGSSVAYPRSVSCPRVAT